MRRDDERRGDEQSWHDREPVVFAAGVAAFALLALLAFAVIRTSDDATEPAQFVAPVVSTTTTSVPTVKTVTPTTSYAVPSVQTSQDNPSPASSSSQPPGPGDVTAGPDGLPTLIPSSAPITIVDPYATTTQPNAGHV